MTPRRFLKSENGSYSVEAVIIFPILLWALGATFVFWDVYKLRNNAAAGTYTVADLVSRQTDAIDAGFLGGLEQVFGAIVGDTRPMDMRVTVMRMDPGSDPVTDPTDLSLVWSQGTDNLPALDDAEALEDNIPIMGVGATLVMVESEVTWFPPLSGVLPQMNLGNRVFVSPRFVPQILFDDGTGGTGGFYPDDGD